MTDVPRPSSGLVQRIIAWLRAGYPDGVPQQDYVALLGILQRNLTPSELDRIVQDLSDDADAGTAIMTHQLVAERIEEILKGTPTAGDISRVSARLASVGWPLGAPPADEVGPRPGLVSRIVDWLRAGYPAGLPTQDYIPLIALLRRRLSDEEVAHVSNSLIESGTFAADRVDVGSAILKVTSEMPSEEDIERVRTHLNAAGWPTDFPV